MPVIMRLFSILMIVFVCELYSGSAARGTRWRGCQSVVMTLAGQFLLFWASSCIDLCYSGCVCVWTLNISTISRSSKEGSAARKLPFHSNYPSTLLRSWCTSLPGVTVGLGPLQPPFPGSPTYMHTLALCQFAQWVQQLRWVAVAPLWRPDVQHFGQLSAVLKCADMSGPKWQLTVNCFQQNEWSSPGKTLNHIDLRSENPLHALDFSSL